MIIFGADLSLSVHVVNGKKDILIPGKVPMMLWMVLHWLQKGMFHRFYWAAEEIFFKFTLKLGEYIC